MIRFHWYRFFKLTPKIKPYFGCNTVTMKPRVRADSRHTSGLHMLCRWSVWLHFASRLYSPNMCVYVTGGVVVVLFLMNYQGHSCSGDRHDLIKCVFKWWIRPGNTLFYDHGKETCQATPSSVCTSISREQRWMALICLPYSLIMISVFLSLCDLHMEAGTVEEYKLTLSVQLRDSLTVFEWTPLFGGWFTLCPRHIHTAAVMQSWRRRK